MEVIQGDCLDVMKTIPEGSVDCVLADPPYGTTACKWDSVIPLEPMWRELKRVVKPRAAIVLMAGQPFTSALVMSNPKWFRYEMIWRKSRPTGFLDAKRKPLPDHETIIVFGDGYSTYNPIMRDGVPSHGGGTENRMSTTIYRPHKPLNTVSNMGVQYPRTVLEIKSLAPGQLHPTQKPVALMSYLIRTYTNPGDTVLDFCCGSGTTGVACIQTGRNCILIEREPEYVEIARRRIKEAEATLFAGVQ